MSSVWEQPETVAGFLSSPPNEVLMELARLLSVKKGSSLDILDIGCGAGRNAVPLAKMGHRVNGIDTSSSMVEAAKKRALTEGVGDKISVAWGTMERLEFPREAFDLVIAHGVWNLATSDEQLHKAIAEASRVCKTGGGLFVFTFSRNTLPAAALPIGPHRHIFSGFGDSAKCFLREDELMEKLAAVGFFREEQGPLTEYNRHVSAPAVGLRTMSSRGPVIYEGFWRKIETEFL